MGHPQAMALAASPQIVAQRRLSSRLDQAPPLARLRTVQRVLNGGAVPALMEGEPVTPASPNAAGFVATDIPAAPQRAVPGGFAHDDIAFSSRDDGAAAQPPPAERSIYFHSGYRLRLQHDEGPHIDPYQMERHTVLPRPGGGGAAHGPDDYHALPYGASFAHMMIPAVAGDPGKLFEIGGGGSVTHISRGRPTPEQGVQDQAHLDRIVGVARNADAELDPLRRQHDRAWAAYEPLRTARVDAERALADARTAHGAAVANQAMPASEREKLSAALVQRRTAFQQAQAAAQQPRQAFMAAKAARDARVAQHNAAMHLAYTGGAAAAAGAGAGAAGGGAGATASTATAATGSARATATPAAAAASAHDTFVQPPAAAPPVAKSADAKIAPTDTIAQG